MPESITRQTVSFPSSDGKTGIHGCIWKSASCPNPRGIVQITHGMTEYIGRYDAFARFLAANGFIVAGHDHLGHGDSITSREDWGHLPTRDGARILVDDMQRMRSTVMSHVKGPLPYFVFGHSMGSFVTRSYITRYSQGLSGAIICGTGNIPVFKSNAGNLLARLIAKTRGERYRSKLLESLSLGPYRKAIKNPRTKLDWLSHDEGNVDAYIADEKCGFMFSAGGNATLTELTAEVCDSKSASKIPHGLPLLYIAGADDPVGDMGKSVRIAADMARSAGVQDVEVHIYENMRHEILSEVENELVYNDVLTWLEEHLS